jgi:hypothetical protein
VKKSFLFISILLCFCKAFAGNHTVQKAAVVSSGEKDGYSFHAVNYPHTEYEINAHAASVYHSYRQQNLQNFIAADEQVQHCFHNQFAKPLEIFSPVFRQYLFHIYPSHNFW